MSMHGELATARQMICSRGLCDKRVSGSPSGGRKKQTNFILTLAYLKDSNAAAHSVDSDIFQSSDSSICDLTLTFIS